MALFEDATPGPERCQSRTCDAGDSQFESTARRRTSHSDRSGMRRHGNTEKREEQKMKEKVTAVGLSQRAIKVDWLATHCHVPFCRIQVSVNRPRLEKALPFCTPLSRYAPLTTAALP